MPIAIGQAPESDFRNPLGMLSDCHRRIARFLEMLITVAEQEQGRNLDSGQRQALEAALKYFREAAPKHTSDEEDSLFPRMRTRIGDASKRSALMTLLHADHLAVVEQHHTVDQLGHAWLRDGWLAAKDAAHLLEVLRGLRETYQEHIEIEETKLFPLAATDLTPVDLREIGKEMAHRRGLLPVGIG